MNTFEALNCACSRQSIILLSLCAGTTATTRLAKFTGCHSMSKDNRDGAEYHLRLKGEPDPRVGLLVQPHSVQVIGEVLGVGTRMKKLEAWSLVLYPSVA